jgi:hypothetical protein
MPRVDSGGRAIAVANGHYPKKLISISRQDCATGAHTCVPGITIKAASSESPRLGGFAVTFIRRPFPGMSFLSPLTGPSLSGWGQTKSNAPIRRKPWKTNFSGGVAALTAIRRASSRVSKLGGGEKSNQWNT